MDFCQQRRSGRSARPGAGGGEEGEQAAAPGPEAEAAAVAAQGRGDADPPAPAAGEEVDSCDEERKERGDEHDLDRPASDDAAAQIDVARRAGGQCDSLLEGVDDVLGRAPDLAEPRPVEPARPVADPARRPVGGRRDRHRRDAARNERRLLVRAEREAEVDELPERTRPERI